MCVAVVTRVLDRGRRTQFCVFWVLTIVRSLVGLPLSRSHVILVTRGLLGVGDDSALRRHLSTDVIDGWGRGGGKGEGNVFR